MGKKIKRIMKSFDNIYITGDTHGDFRDLISKSVRYDFTENDLLIILGDVGINYYGDKRDEKNKDMLASIPCTVFCIRGNHEMRPTNPEIAEKYHKIDWMGAESYIEDKYPKFIMAEDGARYHINGRDFLVIGGAYSVDKYYRLERGYRWFSDEQLTEDEMNAIKQKVKEHGNKEDIILSHTCPYDYRPVECFLTMIDQSTVDNSMERFLQEIVDAIEYYEYYCGHWHIEKQDGKVRFLYHSIIALDT